MIYLYCVSTYDTLFSVYSILCYQTEHVSPDLLLDFMTFKNGAFGRLHFFQCYYACVSHSFFPQYLEVTSYDGISVDSRLLSWCWRKAWHTSSPLRNSVE